MPLHGLKSRSMHGHRGPACNSYTAPTVAVDPAVQYYCIDFEPLLIFAVARLRFEAGGDVTVEGIPLTDGVADDAEIDIPSLEIGPICRLVVLHRSELERGAARCRGLRKKI